LKNIPETALLHPYKDSFLPDLYRPVLEIIALPAYIPAVLQAEFVPVQGTNHVSQGVNVPIGHDAAGMGTFIGKSENFVFIAPQADLFALQFGHGNAVFGPGELVGVVGELVEGKFPWHGRG